MLLAGELEAGGERVAELLQVLAACMDRAGQASRCLRQTPARAGLGATE
jgi:hypothetical protein